MDINDIYLCAEYFKCNFLEKYYIITTYSGRSFVLAANAKNFAHLVGVEKNKLKSNGIRNVGSFFYKTIYKKKVSTKIVPYKIPLGSKMFKKVSDFCDMASLFWDNDGPLAINFNANLSNTLLKNTDHIISDISKGYMLGWINDRNLQINDLNKLNIYSPTTWIDESKGSVKGKEKYLPHQELEFVGLFVQRILMFRIKSATGKSVMNGIVKWR